MRSVSDNGATAPISALTYAFSIGLDRGHETDDFEARIIETAVPGQLAYVAKATGRRRGVPTMRRQGVDQPTHVDRGESRRHDAPQSRRERACKATEPAGNADGDPPSSR
jgi:hypothetical protein